MFFAGALHEGISTALQQSKHVVCFVTDEGDESQRWETDFLVDDYVQEGLRSGAITLRLVAGSDEAGYLEALFPVPRKPTVVVIKNGQLKEYLAAGTAKQEFVKRLGTALSVGTAVDSASSAASSASPAPAGNIRHDELVQAGTSNSQDALYGDGPAAASAMQQEALPASNSSGAATPSSSEERTASVQALLSERAKHLEADQKAQEAATKAEREKRAQERREAARHDNEPLPPNISAAESSYAQMLRRKKQDEKDERQRILRRIEDDKKERREREAQEKQARLLLAATDPDAPATAVGLSSQADPPIQLRRRDGGPTCNLQVRLFDGSTIRGRFSRDNTLGSHVRKWVDDNRTDGDGPYTFRIVLTPLPNKVVEPGEESETLGDLELAPSATLVLVPVIRAASAYAQSGGLFTRGLAYVYSWFVLFFSPVGLLFRGRGADEAQGGVQLENLDSRAETQRIRAFQNAEDQTRDQQLYNGNSLNFEPRRDEDDEAGG